MIFQEPMTADPVLSIGYQLTEPLIQHKKYELMMRILARHTLGDKDFEEIKNAVLGRKRKINGALKRSIKICPYRTDKINIL
jgi:ABC-type dipeptide/oligopeptide/nickel transport system, ATPase component